MTEIENRHSIRRYKDTPVEEEKLMKILESARIAPSGSNAQPWQFIIVKNKETQKKIADVDHNQQWMTQAPIYIVCVADLKSRIPDEKVKFVDEETTLVELKQSIRDTSIAISYILLEAEHQGLGTCWTGWYEQKDVRPILGIPENKYVVGIVTLGYKAEFPNPRPRKTLDTMLRYEKW